MTNASHSCIECTVVIVKYLKNSSRSFQCPRKLQSEARYRGWHRNPMERGSIEPSGIPNRREPARFIERFMLDNEPT